MSTAPGASIGDGAKTNSSVDASAFVAIIFLVISVGIIITLGVGKIDRGSENVRAGIDSGGVRAMHKRARSDSAPDDKNNAVDKSSENTAVREIQERRRIQHHELVFLGGFANQNRHVIRREQVRRVRRHRSSGENRQTNRRRGREEASPIRISRQEVYETGSVGNSEKLMEARPAQVRINQKYFFSQLCERDCKISCHCGFTLATLRARP